MEEWRQRRCEVCGKKRMTRVASSCMCGMSFSFCRECFEFGCEPYGACVSAVAFLGKGEVAEWAQPIIGVSVLRAGKTMEEFWADVEELQKDYERACAEGVELVVRGQVDDSEQ